jgi:Xaa-Pro aminopeptidase
MGRIQKLYNKLENLNLDSLLVTHPANVSYLSGFQGTESAALISLKGNHFLTDFRYYQQAKNETRGFSINLVKNSLWQAVAYLAAKLGLKKLGIESKHLTVTDYKKLKSCLRVKLVPTQDLIEDLRQIKDKGEIELIRKSIQITNEAFIYARRNLGGGLSEKEMAANLERFLKMKGAEKSAFDIIVASGPRSSLPHAPVTDSKLKSAGPILIDMGARFKGYNCDLTRVFFSSKISQEIKRIHRVVLEAKELAKEAVKAGLLANELDNIARSYIDKRGYGKYFGHSLGHGVGREVHEKPFISPKNKQVLEAGMVFTIEPAIYITGKFGIRLEDMVLVTEKGCEALNK